MAQKFLPIEELIPQRPPMLLPERILDVGDFHCVTEARASAAWQTANGEGASEVMFVELIAQTIAISVGWRRRNETKMGGRGVIAGIRFARFYADSVPLEALLITGIKLLWERDNYGVFEGKVELEGKTLCEAELQVFRPE